MKAIAKQATMVLTIAAVMGVGGVSGFARDIANATVEVRFNGAESRMLLEKNMLHPKVSVDLGDGTAHSFIVDTGAGVNLIDRSIAASQGYEVVGETGIGAPGGAQIRASIVKVPLLRVGDVTILNAEFVTMDLIGFSNGTTEGVLGLSLFKNYLVTFDRGAGYIKLSNEKLLPAGPGTLPYDAANSQVDIEINVAGKPTRAQIDTGSMGEFLLPAEMMQSLPLQEAQAASKANLVGGERDIRFARLQGSIQFAGLQFENPNIAFMTPSPGSGNIGSGILADYVLAIDQSNHLIAFRKAATANGASKNAIPRRLGIRFEGLSNVQTMTISGVAPGSLGEQAGLLAGDVLLAINDKPTAQYDMAALSSIFASQVPLKLEIERNGTPLVIDIQ